MEKQGFLKDDKGSPSMMRALSLLALLIGAGLAFQASGQVSAVIELANIKGMDPAVLAVVSDNIFETVKLSLGSMLFAFGGKGVQKALETRK